jgi:hypothetical protein
MASTAMSPLEKELQTALLTLCEKWKTIEYRATYFKRMLTASDLIYKGPVGTVKHLVWSGNWICMNSLEFVTEGRKARDNGLT